MGHEYMKLQEDDIETPDLERIEQTSEISIDRLGGKLNNSDDVVEYEY